MTDKDSLKLVFLCKQMCSCVEQLRSYVEDPPRKINENFHELETCAAMLHGLSMKFNDNEAIRSCTPKAFSNAWDKLDESVKEDDAKHIMLKMAKVFKED